MNDFLNVVTEFFERVNHEMHEILNMMAYKKEQNIFVCGNDYTGAFRATIPD